MLKWVNERIVLPLTVFLTILTLKVAPVFAEVNPQVVPVGVNGVDKAQLIQKIQDIGYGIAAFAGVIAGFFLIVNGIHLMASGGQERKRAEIFEAFKSTIIGLVIAALSTIITGVVVYLVQGSGQ